MYFRAGGKLSPEFVALLSQQTGFYLYKYPASYGSCRSPTMQESPVRVGENHKAIALSWFERPASRADLRTDVSPDSEQIEQAIP